MQGNVVNYEIGTVGPIYATEYEELKSKGYNLDDVVGKSGIEQAMESEPAAQTALKPSPWKTV